jgi:hypothetical protein
MLVVTTLVGFFSPPRLRVHWAPGIPHALFRETKLTNLARKTRGEIAKLCPVVPASEPGPITTGSEVVRRPSNSIIQTIDHAVWVPAFAGTTVKGFTTCTTHPRGNSTIASPVATFSPLWFFTITSIKTQRDFALTCFDFTMPVGWMVSPGLTGLTHLVSRRR